MSPQTLLITCRDQPGLIHTVTGILLSQGVNIVTNAEYVDAGLGQFFMRTEFIGGVDPTALVERLTHALPSGSHVRIADAAPKRIVILAGKEPHCLGDLLMRHHNEELNVRLLAVLSNHGVLRKLVERFDLPFHEIPDTDLDREEHEKRVAAVVAALHPDFLVLAKYMRILTPAFINAWPERIINIHHSFLPAFIGAQPYRQAFARGVKIIGATAHFVTEKLDEGPIIYQSVLPVTHADTARSMAQEGREIEKLVLANALKLLVTDRVFISGNRTVIL